MLQRAAARVVRFVVAQGTNRPQPDHFEYAFNGPLRVRRFPKVKRIVHELSFRTLLYRYFFFGWMFRDVSRGNLLERSAAWQHNQSQAHWLLTYMRRWLWCGILFYGLGGFFELMLNAPGLSAVFYIPSALSLPVNAVIGAVWVGLKAMPGPF